MADDVNLTIVSENPDKHILRCAFGNLNQGELNGLVKKDNPTFFYQLPFKLSELITKLSSANKTLDGILDNEEYLTGIGIEPETYQTDLTHIADLNLFEYFFLGLRPRNIPQDATTVVEILREYSKHKAQHKKPLNICIDGYDLSNGQKGTFTFPWTLCYEDKHKIGEKVEENYFWGFRHVIKQPVGDTQPYGGSPKVSYTQKNNSSKLFSFYMDET